MTAEARIFVDSNVLVYAYDTSAGHKRERAVAVLDELWRDRRGALSIQALQEFFVTVTSKLPRPIAVADARRIIVNLGRWRMHEPDVEDVTQAIDIHRDYEISFWDAMIVRSAAELGCDVLLSEDLNAGQTYRGVRVSNPFE